MFSSLNGRPPGKPPLPIWTLRNKSTPELGGRGDPLSVLGMMDREELDAEGGLEVGYAADEEEPTEGNTRNEEPEEVTGNVEPEVEVEDVEDPVTTEQITSPLVPSQSKKRRRRKKR